jgi:hypothetical protein
MTLTNKNGQESKVPRVLFASGVGLHRNFTEFERLLANQIHHYGGESDFLFCDEILPVCLKLHEGLLEISKVIDKSFREDFCKSCIKKTDFQDLGVRNTLRMSDYIDKLLVENYRNSIDNLSVDQLIKYLDEHFPGLFEHAKAGALRFLARGTLDLNEPKQINVLKEYSLAAIITKVSFEQVLTENDYDVVVLNHGIYVPHGIFAYVCKAKNIRIVTWNLGYRKNSFIFSHGDTYHRELMHEPDDSWAIDELTAKQRRDIETYLLSRESGTEDWIWFHNRPNANHKEIMAELDFENKSLPLVTLFTNVFWDAQIHYPENLFPNMLEWISETIRRFKDIDHANLAIRIHPAEVRGGIPSRQPIVEEISKLFDFLPSNIKVVPPESEISSYELARMSKLVVIYGSKIGVEVSTFGVPVLVAGEAWIKNKGISLDPKTRVEYFEILEGMIEKSDFEVNINRALQYAHHFFFRRTIVVDSIVSRKKGDLYSVELDDLNQKSQYKQDSNLQVIVNGILHGRDFHAMV